MIVTESLPLCDDNQETLLMCSPSQMLNTSTAVETLKKVDEDDRAREAEVYMLRNFKRFMTENQSNLISIYGPNLVDY